MLFVRRLTAEHKEMHVCLLDEQVQFQRLVLNLDAAGSCIFITVLKFYF